ncbi:ferredoxin [Actinocorallia populi]|uniref:ferredoxin n=1 Tax=Actinocorallia populi TaxID=2079200 RepID=UPI001E3CCD87|nr:ferredoxin [Actinocorallia populi]
MVRLHADLDRCRGAGQCVFTAPDLFDQDDVEGKVVILVPSPGPDRLPLADRATVACPNRALTLVSE